ncbi:MAG: alpha/beta hydrolase [Myxococcota bacterium]
MATLVFEDAAGDWAEVNLVTDLWKRAPPRRFRLEAGRWTLELGALPVDRLEYQLELVRRDGTREWAVMPGAPTVDAPFGAKSVLELPAYRPPRWLASEAPVGVLEPLTLASSGGAVQGQLWAAPGLARGAEAPLLVVHDGPEYARFAGLTRYLEGAVCERGLPPLRAALLAPRSRDEEYSASDAWADELAREVLPGLEALAPRGRHPRVGLGASLGGLAMLHARWRHPALFDALGLQSGSFFSREHDAVEQGFARFERIEAFVRECAARPPARRLRVALSCGTGEENLANNEAMAAVLARHGDDVRLQRVRDGHTWTCWRDALDVVLPWLFR